MFGVACSATMGWKGAARSAMALGARMGQAEDGIWQWRGEMSDTISAVTHRLKDKFSSSYYSSYSSRSPWHSVKLADEVAKDIVSEAHGNDRADFRAAVRAALEQRKERFFANDAADPDGYVCGTLGEYLTAMNKADREVDGASTTAPEEPPVSGGQGRVNLIRYLHGIGHRSRAVFFMLGALVFYCLWLWLLLRVGAVDNATPAPVVATLLLAPLVPVAVIDLRMRLSWQQQYPTVYPPPPTMAERLLERPYGLYWWPVLICVPVWIWAVGLIGWIGWAWLRQG